jgi:hypothetical protein
MAGQPRRNSRSYVKGRPAADARLPISDYTSVITSLARTSRGPSGPPTVTISMLSVFDLLIDQMI